MRRISSCIEGSPHAWAKKNIWYSKTYKNLSNTYRHVIDIHFLAEVTINHQHLVPLHHVVSSLQGHCSFSIHLRPAPGWPCFRWVANFGPLKARPCTISSGRRDLQNVLHTPPGGSWWAHSTPHLGPASRPGFCEPSFPPSRSTLAGLQQSFGSFSYNPELSPRIIYNWWLEHRKLPEWLFKWL